MDDARWGKGGADPVCRSFPDVGVVRMLRWETVEDPFRGAAP